MNLINNFKKILVLIISSLSGASLVSAEQYPYGMPMMYGGYGTGAPLFWITFLLFLIILVLLIVYLIKKIKEK